MSSAPGRNARIAASTSSWPARASSGSGEKQTRSATLGHDLLGPDEVEALAAVPAEAEVRRRAPRARAPRPSSRDRRGARAPRPASRRRAAGRTARRRGSSCGSATTAAEAWCSPGDAAARAHGHAARRRARPRATGASSRTSASASRAIASTSAELPSPTTWPSTYAASQRQRLSSAAASQRTTSRIEHLDGSPDAVPLKQASARSRVCGPTDRAARARRRTGCCRDRRRPGRPAAARGRAAPPPRASRPGHALEVGQLLLGNRERAVAQDAARQPAVRARKAPERRVEPVALDLGPDVALLGHDPGAAHLEVVSRERGLAEPRAAAEPVARLEQAHRETRLATARAQRRRRRSRRR